jgi:diacylglycerol kinase family enzyme
MPVPELCVIFNPMAGRQRAARRLAQLRRVWADRAAFWPTEKAAHAEELAKRAAQEGFACVVAAGGDGTVHEVANGLLDAGRPEVVFGIVPIGSANDYAASLAHNGVGQHGPQPVDVAAVSDATGRRRHFVCCLGLGLNGAVTLEARKIKRLQGLALYGLATLRALWYRYATPPLEVTIDDQPPVTWPTLMLSVLLGRREGSFVLAPNARVDDGLFDYLHAGALSRFEVMRFLPGLALWGPPAQHPKVRQGRCRELRLQSPVPLTVHIDGEFFARPEDNVRTMHIRLVPHALRLQVFAPGP